MPGSYEYTAPSVQSGGCAYATLDSYNQNFFNRGQVGAPVPSQARSSEIIIVPSYGGVGYNALQNTRRPSCGGYYGMNNAYPNYPACGQFSSNLCG